jgi:hypothetical protein
MKAAAMTAANAWLFSGGSILEAKLNVFEPRLRISAQIVLSLCVAPILYRFQLLFARFLDCLLVAAIFPLFMLFTPAKKFHALAAI